MPQFSYEAINEAGNTVTGILEADGPEAAKNRLAAMAATGTVSASYPVVALVRCRLIPKCATFVVRVVSFSIFRSFSFVVFPYDPSATNGVSRRGAASIPRSR